MTQLSPFTRILLLGPFVAEDGTGRRVELPKKAQALLAFLLLNRGRDVGRDEAAALLWSNTASEQARQSLRQCLSSIRRAMPGFAGLLVSRGDALVLPPTDSLESDVDELGQFEAFDSLPDLERADRLFRGEFVAGLSMREPFDDWATKERTRLADVQIRLLTRLAAQQRRVRHYAAAVETARRLTDLDPFREESSRLLMQLLAESGQRGLALVEHARVERMLREELQMSPDSDTRRLADMIRRGQPLGERASDARARSASPIGTNSGLSILSERPTIAILPFENVTGHRDDDYVVNALTEEVTSALVRERWPLVVLIPEGTMSESLPYAGARSRYVASASFRRNAGQARITLRLTNVSLGQIVWSGRLEAEGDLLLPLYDQVCAKIVAKLADAVSMAEVGRVARQSGELPTAYGLYLRASGLCRRGPNENGEALRLLRQAIDNEPNFAPSHALAARCLHLRRLMGWALPKDPFLQDAIRFAYRAVEIDDRDPQVLWMSGLAIANVNGNLRDGKQLVARSLEINRTSANAWIASSFINANLGETEAAVDDFQRAQCVNPDDTSQHLQWHAAATAYFIAGRHEEADLAADKALAERPTYPGTLRLKIATSGLLGRIESAHAAARLLRMVNSDPTMAYLRKYWELWPHTEHAVAAMLDGWRRAGMPES